jgi:hypothetical protein
MPIARNSIRSWPSAIASCRTGNCRVDFVADARIVRSMKQAPIPVERTPQGVAAGDQLLVGALDLGAFIQFSSGHGVSSWGASGGTAFISGLMPGDCCSLPW